MILKYSQEYKLQAIKQAEGCENQGLRTKRSLSFIFYLVSGVHNQGRAMSFVDIGLEASSEEPLTASFNYKCFLIYYVRTHGSERNNALNSNIHLLSWKSKMSEVPPGYFVVVWEWRI